MAAGTPEPTPGSREALDNCWRDPASWSARGTYRCAADPRLVVPKQSPGAGWTVNFARPGSVPLLVGIVGLAVGPAFLLFLAGADSIAAILGAIASSAAAVVLLVFGLNRRAAGKPVLPGIGSFGRLPPGRLAEFESEGIVLRDEGIRGSITFRNFRAPGKRYLLRRNWFHGSLVLTRRRFAAFTSFRAIVDLPLDDARLAQLECSVEGNGSLCIRFDPSLFHPGWSGTMEFRFPTSLASDFAERLSAAR